MSSALSSKKPLPRKRKEIEYPTPGTFSEHQRWTRDDIGTLRRYYPTKGSRWVARKLGRTYGAVQTMAGIIGVRFEGQKQWTKKELTYLSRNYHKRTIEEIALTLDRTIGSVSRHLMKMRAEMKRDPEYPFKLQPKSRHRGWTPKQIDFIRVNYGSLTSSEIGKHLGMDARRVRRKAYSLGLTANASKGASAMKDRVRLSKAQREFILRNMAELDPAEIARRLGLPHSRVVKFVRYHGENSTEGVRRLWTEREIAYVRENFGTMLIKDIARSIGRTPNATMRKAKQLGLTAEQGFYMKSTRWSDDEERLLRELYPISTLREIAERLGKNHGAVWAYAKHIGLAGAGNSYFESKHHWTQEEDYTLRELYPTHSARQIAEVLGRSRHAVVSRIQTLRLTGKGKR